MVKSELIVTVAQKSGRSLKASEQAVDLVFQSIAEALGRGERIEIRGFGSWTARHYDSKMGRNPRTGEPINVAAKRLPFFKPGPNLGKLP